MPLFFQPDQQQLRRFLDRQSQSQLTYDSVGATDSTPPAGYVVDHTRTSLGRGDHVFAQARAALERWQQFGLGWIYAWPAETSIAEGEVVVVVARTVGLWWLNACRVIYTIDDSAEQKRFGFAYGTLPGHAGSGEERFLVEMSDDGTVWYDIFAFSRPHGILPRIGYPYMRYVQRQFGRQSAAVMRKLAG